MRPDPRFVNQKKHFWANVRTISQAIGYTVRRKRFIKVPTLEQMTTAMEKRGLGSSHLITESGRATELGSTLSEYFEYRADVLNTFIEPRLLDADQAKAMFERLRAELEPTCPLPMNKQRGNKKAPAYLTCIINMIIEANAGDMPCNYDPYEPTTFTRGRAPLRTLARRVDGAFPSTVNPIAIWEIKEYYYTTTFGSRVADGVYETLLDGMELEELRLNEGVDVKHYLMVDARYTWWDCGRSYLCRIIDMLHMGYVDEVLFGREVAERMPGIVKEWVKSVKG